MSNKFIRFLILIFFALMASGCKPRQGNGVETLPPIITAAPPATSTTIAPPTATPEPTAIAPRIILQEAVEKLPWWNDAIFYEVFVRSFYDSDGDGIGDFNGLTEKLDYLNDGDLNTTNDLGITGLWLMPIHPSPSYHGYDVTDYLAVNPQYGTLEDFRRLLDEAHRRGIKVIIDLVLNHTSSHHPWFVSAAANSTSATRDYYIWSAQNPAYVGPDGQTVWHASPRGDFYYGLFWSGMPDLNYANPAVTNEMWQIARFWLEEMGVDGFRLDAARHLVEEGKNQLNTPATHSWWADFRAYYKAIAPEAVTVGEIWDKTARVAPYAQGDELDLAFDFDLAAGILVSAGGRDARPMRAMLLRDTVLFPPGQFATFITNHDQNRAMDQLNRDFERAKLAAALLLTSPGVPFIYYGEEIGMTGTKPDEHIRTPMQWFGNETGGFTTGTPWQALNPDVETTNVTTQESNPASLLSTYRELAWQRNHLPALRSPYSWFPDTGDSGVYAVLRAAPEAAALVVINLRDEPVSDYALDLESGPLQGTFDITGFFPLTANTAGGFDGYKPVKELKPNQVLILPVTP